MLATYLTQTRQLLQTPEAPESLYTDSSLTSFINTARSQVAGEGECIRSPMGLLPVTAGLRSYDFSAIGLSNASVSSVSGIAGVINVRQALVAMGDGYQKLTPRGWEWFTQYHLNTPIPSSGTMTTWSQLGQGNNGTLWFDAIPDADGSVLTDTVWYPINLVDDNTVEAIPAYWTQAVPYFAAYVTLLGAQNADRQTDAMRLLQLYTEFVNRARQFATPSVLPMQSPQAPDPMAANRLAAGSGAGAGASR